MPFSTELFLAACMFLGAVLYTSVGHAGASAYIALMALFGVAPAVMRPTALALNILVASFTTVRYLRAGMFRWRVYGPSSSGRYQWRSSAAPSTYREHTTGPWLGRAPDRRRKAPVAPRA